MLDLTPTISINEAEKRYYVFGRSVLLLFFIVVVGVVLLKTVFPNGGGYFDFRVYSGPKNTLANPRTEAGVPIKNGLVSNSEKLVFNAAAAGTFSSVEFSFVPKGDTKLRGKVEGIRAYRASLALEGGEVSFRDGSLLVSGNEYFLASNGALRSFGGPAAVERRGYDTAQFRRIGAEVLAAQRRGDVIGEQELFPEHMLFRTEDGYYMYRDGESIPFVSERAYRSQHRPEESLDVPRDIFSTFPESEERIGFLDGTLVSYGPSVYVVEGTFLRPIDSEDTFVLKGYRWEDIVPMTGEEFGIYRRGRLLNMLEPHPNGTLFRDAGDGSTVLIRDGKRNLIQFPELREEYASITPIAGERTPIGSCVLETSWLGVSTCTIALSADDSWEVSEYQFLVTPEVSTDLREMDVRFTRELTKENWSRFATQMRRLIETRYAL